MKNKELMSAILSENVSEIRTQVASSLSERVFELQAQKYKELTESIFDSETTFHYDSVTIPLKKAVDFVIENTSSDYSDFDETIVEAAVLFDVSVSNIEKILLEDSGALTNAKVREGNMDSARGERARTKKKIQMILDARRVQGNPLYSEAQLERLKLDLRSTRHKAYGKTKSQDAPVNESVRNYKNKGSK